MWSLPERDFPSKGSLFFLLIDWILVLAADSSLLIFVTLVGWRFLGTRKVRKIIVFERWPIRKQYFDIFFNFYTLWRQKRWLLNLAGIYPQNQTYFMQKCFDKVVLSEAFQNFRKPAEWRLANSIFKQTAELTSQYIHIFGQ